MLLVPGLIIALIGAHLYLVVKLGHDRTALAQGRAAEVPAEDRGRMKAADKEQYLQDYESLKKQGKPFFPYAILKDSTMALIVVLVIAAMSIVLGAEQGPKVDPTTTTYVPRPEWYFFFAFELLRVLKPPWLVPIATVGIPTVLMVLLRPAPVHRPQPRAAARAAADRHQPSSA